MINDNKVQECQDIIELFNLWKEKHNQESQESTKLTFPKCGKNMPDYSYRVSWTDDGPLGDENTDILFILKESNNKECIIPSNNDFWMKKVVSSKEKKEKSKPIPRRLMKITKDVMKEKFSEDTWFQNVAYMNINKRGGYSKCEPRQLCGYINEYASFIRREIELLNPKYIFVLCGSESLTYWQKIGYNHCGFVYMGNHPGCWGCCDKDYVNSVMKGTFLP